jgi:hypothetical protein
MGSSSKPQTTTTVMDYPDWMEDSWRNNVNDMNELTGDRMREGYQSYGGERIAGFNPFQERAFQNIGQNQGMWQPFLQSASDGLSQSNQLALNAAQNAGANSFVNPAYAGPGTMAQMQSAGDSATVNAGSLPGTNLAGYMNPYQTHVTDAALGKLEQQRQVQNLSNADAATKAKAFGGSRHGVIEAQTNQGFAKQAADTALQGANSNFLNAQSMAQTDLARQLQAQMANQQGSNDMRQFNAGLASQTGQFNAGTANDMAQFNATLAQQGGMFNAQNAGNMSQIQLQAADALRNNAQGSAGLGSMYQNLFTNDNNNLMTAGNQIQDQSQAINDLGYQEWMNARNFPFEMMNYRMGAVNGTGIQPGQSQTTPLYRNRGQGFLGGATTGYGATGNWWGALAGGLLGAYG